jgi:hypothetical protein
MILSVDHKAGCYQSGLKRHGVKIILILACLTFCSTYAGSLSPAQNCNYERGQCGGVVIIPTAQPPPPFKERAPLEINVMFGAVIIGSMSETFNIQAGVNDHLEFEISGGTPLVIILSAGSALTAQDIADYVVSA